ncbi:MAG TPA: hypothetical protein VJQ57_13875 [Acidimicrobiia bacterium]|nr:hypothetical protein [Acidimicrobiia bacterium]
MPMSIPFERGQQFRSAHPLEDALIQVISLGDHHRPGEVFVGTVSNVGGRLIRQRWVRKSSFHDSAVNKYGEPRKSGWVLVTE